MPRRLSSWIIRATTSLPEPVGPEDQHRDVRLGRGADPLEDDEHLLVAADHFAEALHRRRLVLGADRGAPLEERVEQCGRCARARGGRRHTAAASPGCRPDDAELDELAQAVVDVQPQAAERRPSATRRRTPPPDARCRKRSSPARSGDCTSVRNRASASAGRSGRRHRRVRRMDAAVHGRCQSRMTVRVYRLDSRAPTAADGTLERQASTRC